MQTIFNHRSIRKYQTKEVPSDVLMRIIEAANRASNTGNMQLVSVVATTNSDIKKALSPAHFNQKMITEAPLVLTFCADVNRMNKWCDMRNAKHGFMNMQTLYTATIDATIAAQNAALEAEHLGLGICYLGTTTYNARQIIETLKLPKGVMPVTTITVGYPADMPELTERLPVDAILHMEQYKDYCDETIDSLYAEREQLESNKQFCRDNNKENLAQVFAEVRYTKENNEFFSKELMDTLKLQGFLV
ncbi:MAG: nitroreductase family protein [Bacteroidales bacterium]|nr:nitroreductase family protein [Bacteroidales bacterium]